MTRTGRAAIVIAALLSTFAAQALGTDFLIATEALDVFTPAEGSGSKESEASTESQLTATPTRRSNFVRHLTDPVKHRLPISPAVWSGSLPHGSLSRNLASRLSRWLC